MSYIDQMGVRRLYIDELPFKDEHGEPLTLKDLDNSTVFEYVCISDDEGKFVVLTNQDWTWVQRRLKTLEQLEGRAYLFRNAVREALNNWGHIEEP